MNTAKTGKMADLTLSSSYSHERKWWKEAVVYQIYPSSFYDSNGDGIGDIPGIIEKLPYLEGLGIDCVWLSPHYDSPQVDMGYDISDYEDIYPPYGTLEQCQQLIDGCHKRGMKIIFDLVINHTSDQHAWFKESRSSKTNPKRDWYMWKPPKGWKDGKPIPPTNWRANFGGSVWSFDETTNEYYLHLFAAEQPDLNWENTEARKAIYETSMHFWLKRGIDGFRVDTVNKYSKVVTFPDAPIVDPDSFEQPCYQYTNNGPRIHEFLNEMYEVLSQYKTLDGGEIMTVGELPNTPNQDHVRAYVSATQKQLNMVFNFETVQLGQVRGDRTKTQLVAANAFKNTMSMWQNFVNDNDAWTTVFLENHDQGRSISRFGDDSTEEMRTRSGLLLAMVSVTLTGTLFLYQGQEIGMTNLPLTWELNEYKDIWSVNMINKLKAAGASQDILDSAKKGLQKVARDNARTPVQWNDSAHSGFCKPDVTPWMRVIDNYTTINVKQQESDEGSVLSFWKQLIRKRKQFKDIWTYGKFTLLNTQDTVFAFEKEAQSGEKTMTAANMSGKTVPFTPGSKILLSNVGTELGTLQPWEARIYTMD